MNIGRPLLLNDLPFFLTDKIFRSMSIGGRSMMGDSFCTSSYDTDEIGDSNSANYIYIQRNNKLDNGRVYEDPYPASPSSPSSPKPKPRVRHFSQSNPASDSSPSYGTSSRYASKSVTDSPRLLSQVFIIGSDWSKR